MSKYQFKLYITGKTTCSDMAIANLKNIFRMKFKDEYELMIFDILDYPELAEEDEIMATPTLIKCFPAPARKIIGDFSDTQKVLAGLHLTILDEN
ncbi:MAG: circadian clock protein KaiB [Ignavibacteriales bacterium]|nr:circadian clock protein KaiB [Ignavibacteriales bacterium]